MEGELYSALKEEEASESVSSTNFSGEMHFYELVEDTKDGIWLVQVQKFDHLFSCIYHVQYMSRRRSLWGWLTSRRSEQQRDGGKDEWYQGDHKRQICSKNQAGMEVTEFLHREENLLFCGLLPESQVLYNQKTNKAAHT